MVTLSVCALYLDKTQSYIKIIKAQPEVVPLLYVVIVPSHEAMDETVLIWAEDAGEVGAILLTELLEQ